jgi:hypothetical protein
MSLLHRNLNLASVGAESIGAIEFPIFSSTDFTHGDWSDNPPITVFNNIGISGEYSEKLHIRLELYSIGDEIIAYIRQYIDKNTGSYIQNEISSLFSLYCGCPMYAGAITREFRSEDNRGYPYRADTHPAPRFIDERVGIIVPKDASVEGFLEFLNAEFRLLAEDKANYFVRACMSYQKAIWISDLDPNLSFLMLCSAVETLASCNAADYSFDYNLPEFEPELYSHLQDIGSEKLTILSGHLSKTAKSTRKFIDFLVSYAANDNERAEHDPAGTLFLRSEANIKDMAGKVYRHRSKALHESISFPLPMLRKPRRFNRVSLGDKFVERIEFSYAMWQKKSMPVYLQTFAAITRDAMLHWLKRT